MFGVGFADGRKAMLGRLFPPNLEEDPDGPVLMPRGGGAGGEEWRMGMWLWPLPPSGPLTVVTSWAERDQNERAVTIDAAELVEASEHAEQLWVVDENAVHGAMGGGYSVGHAILAKRSDDKPPPPAPA
jgi:hypothetical protein